LTFNAWLRFDGIRHAFRGAPRDTEILEIGPGQGAMSARIAARFRYEGIEADAVAADVARPRIEAHGGRLRVGSVDELVDGRRYDAVCAFEVLEHIEDDLGALRGWWHWVRPGGRLVLSVPSQPHRFGPWDVAVGHHRRYDRSELTGKLHEAGFERIEVRAHGWPLGYVLEGVRDRLAARTSTGSDSMEVRTAASGRRLQPGQRFGALTWVLTLPFRLAQLPVRRSRWGTGFTAVAHRPHEG
jgi:SAM-dependent methyltransferase